MCEAGYVRSWLCAKLVMCKTGCEQIVKLVMCEAGYVQNWLCAKLVMCKTGCEQIAKLVMCHPIVEYVNNEFAVSNFPSHFPTCT